MKIAIQGEPGSFSHEAAVNMVAHATIVPCSLSADVFGALAQYERALTRERVVAGLAAARRRGRVGGRPAAIAGEKLEAVLAALNGGMSKAAVCRNFGVKRTTLLETLARLGEPHVATSDVAA